MSVGTNADRITTVTSSVYWVRVMYPWLSATRLEMEPNVRPVAISRVV